MNGKIKFKNGEYRCFSSAYAVVKCEWWYIIIDLNGDTWTLDIDNVDYIETELNIIEINNIRYKE